MTDRMSEHHVSIYARAIAFQVLTTLIPPAPLVLAVGGSFARLASSATR